MSSATPVSMTQQPARQQIDLSKRTMEEQMDMLKGPFYSAHAKEQKEVDRLIDNCLGLLDAKEQVILQNNVELKQLRQKLEKFEKKGKKEAKPKPKKK